MTYKACVDYAQYYRELARVAATAEAWRLYKQLAHLWELTGSELTRPDEAESKVSSAMRPGRHQEANLSERAPEM